LRIIKAGKRSMANTLLNDTSGNARIRAAVRHTSVVGTGCITSDLMNAAQLMTKWSKAMGMPNRRNRFIFSLSDLGN
jgi:hypothetical protein